MATTVLMDSLKCPVCFEIPDSEVYQCRKGHIFCLQCSNKLSTCPQCRATLDEEKIRNRTLEQLLELMEFCCPNKELGCGKLLKRHEIASHLLHCKFEPFYFCKLIGFQHCPFNAAACVLQQSNKKLLLAHLQDAHPEIEESCLSAEKMLLQLNYHNFLTRAAADNLGKGSTVIWTPHLIRQRENVFLLLCQISSGTRNAAWICLRMTDEGEQDDDGIDNFIIQYKVRGDTTNNEEGDGGTNESMSTSKLLLVPELTWRAPVISFTNIGKNLESYALRIPLCVIASLSSKRSCSKNNKNNDDNGLLRMRIKLGAQFPRNNNDDNDKLNLEQCGKADRLTIPVTIKELTEFVSSLPVTQAQTTENPTNGGGEENENRNGSRTDDGSGSGGGDRHGECIVFDNIYCNACNMRPIRHIRFKCLQCLDYDLCKNCMEARVTHTQHVFARIQDARQNDLFNWKHRLRMLRGKSSYI